MMMLRLVLTILCCSVSVSALARGAGDINVDYNTHRPGNDYVNFRIYSVNDCIDACARDNRCVAFDYIKSDRRCWLKDRVPMEGWNNNAISGVKNRYHHDDKRPKKNKVVAGILLEEGIQRPWGDYTSYPAKNARQCARNCADDYRCQSFDFTRHNRTCWLKDRVSAAIVNPDVVSGVKKRGHGGDRPNILPDQVAGMQLYPNVKRNGGDYTTFTVRNVEECARACANDNRCQSFNYGKQRQDCWLKSFVPNGFHNNTVISGVKAGGRQSRW